MSMDYYAGLIDDPKRIDWFRQAIAGAVREGDRVLDVGTGLGTYALFAADAGAASVWAVDSEPVAYVARGIVRDRGFADVVRVVRGTVPEVTLPERVDVVVFEDFAVRLISSEVHALLRSLADRYVKPGGRLVPEQARICLAPVAGGELRSRLFPAGEDGFRRAGLVWSEVRPFLANQPRALELAPGVLCGEPVRTPLFPLLPPPPPSSLCIEGAWVLTEDTGVEALAYWFELHQEGMPPFTTAPGEGSAWGQLVLPLDPPLEARAGDRLTAWAGPGSSPAGTPGWMAWRAACGGEERRGNEFGAGPEDLTDLFPSGGKSLTVEGAGGESDAPARSEESAP